ncbi:MAG: hypothetical protein C4539_06010 [Ignavibacteriales bacterium]|nr:MAG: hypothetical protein C4539_06010 [Ignavibacteriales bacterium]
MKLRICLLISLVVICNAAYSQIEIDDLDSLLNVKLTTASKYWQSTSEVPATTTIVTAKEIQAYGFSSLAEMLRTVSGFYVSDERNYSYTGVQSFSRPTDYMNRVLLLVNGHSINDNIYGGAFINGDLALNMNSIERVEIVRGPGSVLYGTSAMLAIVNVITKKFNLVEQFNATLEAGSYNKYQAKFYLSEELFNGFNFFLSGNIANIKGESTFIEWQDNDSVLHSESHSFNWEKNNSLFLSLNYNYFTLNSFYSKRKKDIPMTARGPQINSNGYTGDEINFTEIKFDKDLSSDLKILLRGYYDYNYYKREWEDNLFHFDESEGFTYGFETQFLWDIFENHRLTFGGEYKNNSKVYYHNGDMTTTFFSGNFPYNVFGFYLQDEYQAYKNLSLSVGFRADKYSNIGAIYTPRLAIMYNPFEQSTLKLLYGEAYRAPNTYELYIVDPKNNYSGNPNLKSEKIKTIELTLDERLSKSLIGSISLYNYNFSHLIETRFDSVSLVNQFSDYNKVYANGVEVEFNAKLKEDLDVRTSYSFQYAKQDEADNRKSSSICHLVKFALVLPVFESVYVSTDMLYEFEKFTMVDTRTRSFYLANANLLIKDVFNHFDVSFKINNLTDKNYYNNFFFKEMNDLREVNQIGRNFIIKVEYNF